MRATGMPSWIAAIAASQAEAAPLPVPAAALAPSDTLNIGQIGVGIRGSQLMDEFSRIPGVNLAMAADLYDGYLQHAREFLQDKVRTTKHYEDVLNDKSIDAVIIATPDHWHKKMTLDALSAGKHAYIEKPMTWSVEEGPEIIAAEKRSGKVVMVGSGGKTTTLVAKCRELVMQGALGPVRQIRMMNYRNSREGAWQYPIPPDASPKTIDWERFLGHTAKKPFTPEVFFRWRCWWEYSGGVATDLAMPTFTATANSGGFSIADPTSYTSTTSQTVYDSLGNPHTQSLYFVKTAQANKWDVYTSLDGGFPPEIDPVTGLHSPTTVSFDSNGGLLTPKTIATTYTVTTGATKDLTITVDLNSSTQFGNSFGVSTLSQNGYKPGTLSGLTVEPDGTILGNFSNGQSRTMGHRAQLGRLNLAAGAIELADPGQLVVAVGGHRPGQRERAIVDS